MHAILTLHEKVRVNELTRRGTSAEVGLATGVDTGPLADDEGADTDDGRTRAPESTTGWTPDRPDAVHLGTPKRNPVIARSVGEPL